MVTMPRPKQFDVERTLQRALDVFWQKGYEATSMHDLVAAMRIQKSSIYATFGDKHSLYVTALRRYQQQALDELTERLAKAPSPLAAIREFVLDVLERAAGQSGRFGCFCVNANIELAPRDASVADHLRKHHQRMLALLVATLQRAQAQGELRRDADPAAWASFLLGIVAALNVLGKQRTSRQQLQAVVDLGLATLER